MPEISNIDSDLFLFNTDAFKQLMKKRIMKVLLICSNYDAYILEQDGRIEENLFNEYAALNLRYPPFFIHANTIERALEILQNGGIDLIITMLNQNGNNAISLANSIKNIHPTVPIVALTHFSKENYKYYMLKDTSNIDYIFSWLGNTDLLLAIIKLLEDKMNVEQDVRIAGIQTILLVEDSVRFYSGYLPHIYNIMYRHSKAFKLEGLNNHQQNTMMRGRPKVLLATNYEEAIQYYEKYKLNLLGVITDVNFSMNGKKNGEAGLTLANVIRKENPNIPILVQSYSGNVQEKTRAIHVDFLDKKQKDLPLQIREYLFKRFAMGDFTFKRANGEIIDRASNLREFQNKILTIPEESIIYHLNKESFARWLKARALFNIAEILAPLRSDDFDSIKDIRMFIHSLISNYRQNINRGIIAKFDSKNYDEYSHFSRIGDGSLGGKARGLSFADMLLKKNKLEYKFTGVAIEIPKTVVICSDIFDSFISKNKLFPHVLEETDDLKILSFFQNAEFTAEIEQAVKIFLSRIHAPIAVRSSSVLEDSHYRSFAGVYSTYMIAPCEIEEFTDKVLQAIKSVYASVYFSNSKKYIAATSNVIDEEKMSVILQEINGQTFDSDYYPTISGVARSRNYYPIEPETFHEPIANLAVGFGGLIVSGERNLRFSPMHPNSNLQLSTPQLAMSSTQKEVLVLDLNDSSFIKPNSTECNLKKRSLRSIKHHKSLYLTCSHMDLQNNFIREGFSGEGIPIVTFNKILRYNSLPLCDIIKELLAIGQKEIGCPIEIEFSLNLSSDTKTPHLFNLLQIRPFLDSRQESEIQISKQEKNEALLYSTNVMGNGKIKGVQSIIFIKPRYYSAKENELISELLNSLNEKKIKKQSKYILIGPGRWGSSDHNLGIPVKWSNISHAKLIIEMGIENFSPDPSNGTHFFHNLINLGVGYFTIIPYKGIGTFATEKLNMLDIEYEDEYLICYNSKTSLQIKIDGKHKEGIVKLP